MTEYLVNLLAILFITAAIIIFIYALLYRVKTSITKNELLSYTHLCKDTLETLNNIAGVGSLTELGVSNQTRAKIEKQRLAISGFLRTCCSGDDGAREAIKDLIRKHFDDIGVNDSNINRAIPFDRPDVMTARQMADSLLYYFDGGTGKGFEYLHDNFGWGKPVTLSDGSFHYEVTEQQVKSTWYSVNPTFSYAERLDILAQMVFSDTVGLGVADIYNQQKGCIEEIQIGLTGQAFKIYDYKSSLLDSDKKEKIEYSKDSLHVVVRGFAVRLSYLSFETDNEQQRVLRILLQNSTAGELTLRNAAIVTESPDGRRMTEGRPPATSAWIGFIRKFDSAFCLTLNDWCKDMERTDVIAELIRNLTRSGTHICITGEMIAGKTTLERACIRETRSELNFRNLENDSLEFDDRKYLPGRNTLSIRISEDTPVERVIAFARKTSGHIFSIAEISSAKMALVYMEISKISQQMFTSAHFVSTEDMVRSFTNANLSVGGYTNERLAEIDATKSLGFDVHIHNYAGVRYIQYINEIVPDYDSSIVPVTSSLEDINSTDGLQGIITALYNIGHEMKRTKTFTVRPIMQYDVRTGCYKFLNKPSERCYEKASWYMPQIQYDAFCAFFDAAENLLCSNIAEMGGSDGT